MMRMESEYKYMACTQCMTYNHSPYILETLKGFAIQQTSFPIVFCVIDDASPDGEADAKETKATCKDTEGQWQPNWWKYSEKGGDGGAGRRR